MSLRQRIAEWLSLLTEQLPSPAVALSFANASEADTIEADGFWIGERKRGGRFVRYPDGELRKVDRDFDPGVFDDPESLPTIEGTSMAQTVVDAADVPDVEPSADGVEAIAQAMLATYPTSLVAVYHDAKGKVLGSTVTPAKRGLSAAVFRAALRSLPARAKQVTFAASGNIASDVRDAATEASEVCLVRVLGFIIH